jgi:hypothetical protein
MSVASPQTKPSHAVFSEVSENAAEAIANGSDPKLVILGVIEELGLSDTKEAILRRFDLSGSEDHNRCGLYFILSGARFPSRKGYTWA